MKRILLLLACMALVLPAIWLVGPARAQSRDDDGGIGRGGLLAGPLGFDFAGSDRFRVLDRAREPQEQAQVRIERRVVVRIAPSSNATRSRLMAELPRRPLRTQYQETEHGDCVPIAALAGVQPMDDHRLLLIMRDRQLLTASLERSCSAEAFYSGFYIERNEDGRLCVSRDRLQSRAGASCEVDNFSRLVAVRD